MKKLLLTSLLTIFSLCAFSQVPNYVPTNGLVGWWPFNGNANDESVNTNDGTVNGATLASDRNGNSNSAYSFDGLNDNISAYRSGLNQFSISLWFNTNQNSSFTPFIDANNINWELYLSNLKPTFTKWISLLANYQEYISSTIISTSQWYNLICVFTSNNVNLFLNGNLISSFTNVTLPNINNGNYYFGASISGVSQFYNGILDDIGIWNRALTQCEIQDLYTSQLNSSSVSAGLDQTICNGDAVTLSATNSQNYSWNNSVVDGVSFSPTTTQDYIVSADSTGCLSTDTVSVMVNQPSMSSQTQTALDSLTLNNQTYTQSGTYTQVIPNAAGCDSIITLDLTLSFTGMIELNGSTLTLSPNPVQDVVSILVDSKLIGEEFTIIDQLGAIVLKGTLKSEKTEIDLSKYSSGMYLFRLINYSEKVIRVLKK
jgi:hypothetical protein